MLLIFVCLYLTTHLIRLGDFPIFADEAIYIRWAQLIIDDPGRYLFFALNDGKTPLFIWLMVPFQHFVADQVVAGRLASVMVGLAQLLLAWRLMDKLRFANFSKVVGALMFTFLPYWYFHHRMALMDGLLVLFVSLMALGVVEALEGKRRKTLATALMSIGLAGGLWTKLPAIVAIPSIIVFALLMSLESDQGGKKLLKPMSLGMVVGLAGFLLMAIHPSFGQLFNRGGDFLFPAGQILLWGGWQQTLPNFPEYIRYFLHYLTPAFLVFLIVGLFNSYRQLRTHAFFWAGLAFVVPIGLMGIVVFPRYLLPAAFFLTMATLSGVDAWVATMTPQREIAKRRKPFAYTVATSAAGALLLGNSLVSGLDFLVKQTTDYDKTPFVSADRGQYLEEWASGHGIRETVQLIRAESQHGSLAVATEGYFGTLPDGLLVYMHGNVPDNVATDGIGQPVGGIPDWFVAQAKSFDKIWLVVNSHRLKMRLNPEQLVNEYCRPNAAPCLQVWDITQNIKE